MVGCHLWSPWAVRVGLFWAQETPKPGRDARAAGLQLVRDSGEGPLPTLCPVPRWWENRYHKPRHPVPSVPPPSATTVLSIRGLLHHPSGPPAPALRASLALATVPFPSLPFKCTRISYQPIARSDACAFYSSDPRKDPSTVQPYHCHSYVPMSAAPSGLPTLRCAVRRLGLSRTSILPRQHLTPSPHLILCCTHPTVRSVAVRRRATAQRGRGQSALIAPRSVRNSFVAQLDSCTGGGHGSMTECRLHQSSLRGLAVGGGAFHCSQFYQT